jgi:hypothetical protein
VTRGNPAKWVFGCGATSRTRDRRMKRYVYAETFTLKPTMFKPACNGSVALLHESSRRQDQRRTTCQNVLLPAHTMWLRRDEKLNLALHDNASHAAPTCTCARDAFKAANSRNPDDSGIARRFFRRVLIPDREGAFPQRAACLRQPCRTRAFLLMPPAFGRYRKRA